MAFLELGIACRGCSVRTWLVVTFAAAALCAWARSVQGSLEWWPYVGYTLLTCTLVVCAGLALGHAHVNARRTMRPRLPALLALCFLIAAQLYVAWTWSIVVWGECVSLSRPLPFPDRLIAALERWFDARHPVPPGYFKIEGEFQRVRFLLELAGMAIWGLLGAVAGLLWKGGARGATRLGNYRFGPASRSGDS